MAVKPLPIFTKYNQQQFLQACPEDNANWTLILNKEAKKQAALYPALGRKHVVILDNNILYFEEVPRAHHKSVDYYYVFEGDRVWRYDRNFARTLLTTSGFSSGNALIYFTKLVAPGYTLAVFTNGTGMWVHNENTSSTVRVTDSNLIDNPTALIAFGNRIAVTGTNTTEMVLSKINLGALSGDNVNAATCFTLSGGQLSAFETENIVNFAVLHNTLYVFLQSSTSIWSNIPSVFSTESGTVVQFPWKKNTTYNFDYGLSAPFAMDTNFGRLTWLGQNQDGLAQIVSTEGGQPKKISTKAIDILLERDSIADELSPFIARDTTGFLYQYQNTVYFRLSAGKFYDFGILDVTDSANSIEYNFDTEQWKRCIELNGERNRITSHVYFKDRHLVLVQNEKTVYEMSGQFFVNEIRNTEQTDPQASDAYVQQPFRYELQTTIISEEDYGEFLTDFVQIDFVWGDRTFVFSENPFETTTYIVTEDDEYIITEDGEYVIEDGTNEPVLNEQTYNLWFKPTIELFWSDDGGISFNSADVREFSQLGVYNWRMRWYELGPSRNRVYKLVCVSPAPIVVLGGIMDIRQASDGAY